MTSCSGLPGVDFAALTHWLDDERPGLRQGPIEGELIAGGRSNLTYRISDGTRSGCCAARRSAHVLPTAHDMAREYRVITALRDTAVPVPLTYALCADPDVLGAPFYVMSFVDGVVFDRTADQLAALGPGAGPAGIAERAGRHPARSCTRSTRPRSGWRTSAAPTGSSPARSPLEEQWTRLAAAPLRRASTDAARG